MAEAKKLVKGDKYIFKDANNFEIRTFIGEQKNMYYSKENGMVGDRKAYCRQILPNTPLQIRNQFDNTLLEFCDFDIAQGYYIYIFVEAVTKKGLRVPFTEEQLIKHIKVSTCSILPQ